LFGLSQPELHLRELVRQSGLSLGTVQQELRRLTRVGLVTARKDGWKGRFLKSGVVGLLEGRFCPSKPSFFGPF